MNIDQKIESTINRGIIWWLVSVVLATIYVAVNYSLWWLLPLAVGAWIAYYLTLSIVGIYLGLTISQSDVELDVRKKHGRELNKRLFGVDVEEADIEAAGIQMGQILSSSPEIVGYLGYEVIYEWIEVMDPHTGKGEIFTYRERARLDGENVILPQEEGKIFAVIKNLVYERSST